MDLNMEKKRKKKTQCGGYIAGGKLGCRTVKRFPQNSCVWNWKWHVSATWREPQATQHKGHPSPTVTIFCHCPDILGHVSGTCHGDKVRGCLHLGRRTLANRMCLLLPASSPKGGKMPFWADEVALYCGATGDAKNMELVVRNLGSKSWQYHQRQIKWIFYGSSDFSCTWEGWMIHAALEFQDYSVSKCDHGERKTVYTFEE